jgi:hypothetical protein
LSFALALGLLTFLALFLLYIRLPRILQKIIIKTHIIVDILATIGTYIALGTMSTSKDAALASAEVCVLVSLGLIFARQREQWKKKAQQLNKSTAHSAKQI